MSTPTAERVLTVRDLNRAVLERQLLLERAELPVARALDRMGTLQNQYAPNGYIGLWSRVADFERDDLTRALRERSVIQATLMRETIHLASREDFWPLALATRRSRREWWVRVNKRRREDDVAAAAERLRGFLSDGARSWKEIVSLLGRADSMGVGHWVDLVRVPPSGTWERRRADLYALAEQWVGAEPPLDEGDAIEHLVRRYLGAFGPALPTDVARWSGIPVRRLAPTLARLELRRFRDEAGKELVDLPNAPLPASDARAPVRFLPTWDATLLVHARGKGVLPEELRPRIFNTKVPFSMHTFLVDGVVAGAWRFEDGRIELQFFRKLTRAELRELEPERERLAALHA